MVKALRYLSDGPGIDPRWCHLGFFFPWFLPTKPCALRSTQPLKMSSPEVKAAGAFGGRPTTLVVPKVEKIRGLNLTGTPWTTSACREIPLLYSRCLHCKFAKGVRERHAGVKETWGQSKKVMGEWK